MGRPSRSASANIQATPSTMSVSPKLPLPPFTTRISAAGAMPAYVYGVPSLPVAEPSPAALPATWVPWPFTSCCRQVAASSSDGSQYVP